MQTYVHYKRESTYAVRFPLKPSNWKVTGDQTQHHNYGEPGE